MRRGDDVKPRESDPSTLASESEATVESLLQSTPESNKASVLFNLLSTEIRQRSMVGDSVSAADYKERFPGFEDVIDDLFKETADHSPSRYHRTKFHRKGGLGEIWRAQDIVLNREVALKTLHSDLAGHDDVRRRFLREAMITAKLQHPNIVPIHSLEVATEDGDPFYTMRFVKGKTLREEIAAFHNADEFNQTELRHLLGVFLSICNAVRFAHSHNIIHRDLKPDNVVVGDYGEVFVLDWGLAKSLAVRDSSATGDRCSPKFIETLLTQPGSYLGTPAYSAPEQAEAADDTDTRTDIYGLGAILYELLTGRPPTPKGITSQATEIPPPRQINASIPAPLSSIASKALKLERSDRYADVESIVQDIELWLADEPVSVHTDNLFERATRWLRKHRRVALAGIVSTLVVALVSAAAAFAINAARSAEQQRNAELERLVYISDVHDASDRINSGNFELADKMLRRCPEHLRGWEWRHSRSRANQVRAFVELEDLSLTPDESQFYSIRYTPEGRLLVGTVGSEPHFGYVEPGAHEAVWNDDTQFRPAALTPVNHKSILVCPQTGPTPDMVGLVNPHTGDTLSELTAANMVVDCSDDGETIALSSIKPNAMGWEYVIWSNGKPTKLNVPDLRGCQVADDLIASFSESAIQLWRPGESEVLNTIPATGTRNVAISADAKRLAIQHQSTINLVDISDPTQWVFQRSLNLTSNALGFSCMDFSADHKVLAVSEPSRISVWDVDTGLMLAALPQYVGSAYTEVMRLAVNSDGSEVAIQRRANVTVWKWNHDSRESWQLFDMVVEDLQIEDGKVYAVGADSTGVHLVSLDLESEIREVLKSYEFTPTFLSKRDEWIATSMRNKVQILDIETGREYEFEHGKWPESGFDNESWLPNSCLIALSGHDLLATAATDITYNPLRPNFANAAFATPTEANDEMMTVTLPFGDVDDPAFKSVMLWDLSTGKRTRELAGHEGMVMDIAFSPSGDRLLSASLDKTIRVWDPKTGATLRQLKGHRASVFSLEVDPSGRYVASGDLEGQIIYWDISTGEQVLTLDGHFSLVHGLAFSPDGSRLASVDLGAGIRLWDMKTGRELLFLDTLGWTSHGIGFTERGDLYAIASLREVWFWRSSPPPHRFVERTLPKLLATQLRPVRGAN